MSKKKNTKGNVPSTKVEAPKVIKLTKTQRELFVTKRNAGNESLNVIVGEVNKHITENLSKIVDTFIEELKIDVNEDWLFDANTLQFTKQDKRPK